MGWCYFFKVPGRGAGVRGMWRWSHSHVDGVMGRFKTGYIEKYINIDRIVLNITKLSTASSSVMGQKHARADFFVSKFPAAPLSYAHTPDCSSPA